MGTIQVGFLQIELSQQDAELYKQFCKDYEDYKILLKSGMFELPSGQIIIDKHNKVIQNIKISVTPFQRGKER